MQLSKQFMLGATLIILLTSGSAFTMDNTLFGELLESSSPRDFNHRMFQKSRNGGAAEMCPDSLFAAIFDDLRAVYPIEVHNINTDDGYILRVFRIQARNTQIVRGKPVAVLQHGTMDSADDWIVNRETNSIGLRLANEGYDVWLLNSRGNKYSMKTKTPMKEKEFWDFSFEEMARYDLPASIRYVE